jgi:hypothetical protein
MNAVASARGVVAARVASPLVAVVVGVFALHVLEGALIGSAWLLPDETSAARAGASLVGASGDGGTTTLYSVLTAPLWLAGTATGYALVKLLGAVFVALAAVPTYRLALLVTTRRIALGAAVTAVVVPATLYGEAVEPAAFAYLPGTAGVLFAVLYRINTRNRDAAIALALAVLAIALWPASALVLVPIYAALSAAAVGWKRLAEWPGAAILVVAAAVAYAGYYGLRPHSQLVAAFGSTDAWELFRDSLASLGVLALSLAVVGLAAALAVAGRPTREHAAVTTTALVGTAAAAAASAVSAATTGTDARVDERMLLLAVPPVAALAAGAIGRRPQRVAIAIAVGATAVAIASLWGIPTPRLEPHAPTLAIAHALGLDPLELALVWIVLAVIVVVAVRAIGGSAFAARRRTAVAIAFVVVVTLAAEAVAAGAAHQRASDLRAAHAAQVWPGGDREGGLTIVGAPGTEDTAASLLFWNPDAAEATPPLDARIINSATGEYAPPLPQSSYYLDVGAARGTPRLAGRVLERAPAGALIEAAPPERAVQTTEGLYPDGWTGAHAAFRYFGPGPASPADVVLSRTNWGGPDVANHVTVAIGPIGSEPQASQRVIVHAGQAVTVRLAAPPDAFQITIDSETFSPSRYGQSDTRELGVQPTFVVHR